MPPRDLAGIPAALRLGVIFGGRGPEHEASLSSASAVMRHLDPNKFRVAEFGIAKTGEWVFGAGSWRYLYRMADPHRLPLVIRNPQAWAHTTDGVPRMSSLPDLQQLCKVDCIFPIVDGVGGEDGSLQGLLSFVRRPVVGSPLLAAAQAYNKWTAKQVVAAAGVPVTKGIVVNAAQSRAEIVDQLSWTFRHWDLIVKPVSCGSSFGVSRTWSAADLDDALSSAFAFDHAALVEEYIEHVEIYVGVLSGEAGLIVAPPAADAPGPIGYSTYTDKYIDIEAPMDCPSKLEPKVNQEVMELAVTAFNAIGCTDFARLDFFYSLRTKSLLFNELNTMPAMAPYCAFPTVMRAAGLSYERMVETLVGAAIKRYAGSGSRYPVVPRIEERKVA